VTDLARGRLAIKYMIFELLPVFVAGLAVFIFVLIMVQSFKLSEYIIVHGAQADLVFKLLGYMLIGSLPTLFPITLLFSVLFVYGRMSGDSEIVAFKALGLRPVHLLLPAIIVGIVMTLLSLQVAFRLAPWGQRRLDELINVLSQTRPGAAIREGVFSQGFFDLVVYANKVESSTGKLHKIFIFDERDADAPVTIIAKEGLIENSNSINGSKAYLKLMNGNMHKTSNEFYTKIDFESYKINLFNPHVIRAGSATPDQLNLQELRTAIHDPTTKPEDVINLELDLNRRWGLSVACLVFAVLGVSLGAVTNRRTARSGSLVICISTIVIYWTLKVACESLARNAIVSPFVAALLVNLIFLAFAVQQFRRNVVQG
jgi:lipopolysaccharide export system permease protein